MPGPPQVSLPEGCTFLELMAVLTAKKPKAGAATSAGSSLFSRAGSSALPSRATSVSTAATQGGGVGGGGPARSMRGLQQQLPVQQPATAATAAPAAAHTAAALLPAGYSERAGGSMLPTQHMLGRGGSNGGGAEADSEAAVAAVAAALQGGGGGTSRQSRVRILEGGRRGRGRHRRTLPCTTGSHTSAAPPRPHRPPRAPQLCILRYKLPSEPALFVDVVDDEDVR